MKGVNFLLLTITMVTYAATCWYRLEINKCERSAIICFLYKKKHTTADIFKTHFKTNLLDEYTAFQIIMQIVF